MLGPGRLQITAMVAVALAVVVESPGKILSSESPIFMLFEKG